MSEITWNDLPADEQELMRGALPDGYSPDTNIEIARCASLARKGLAVETWGEYTLTDAGRALIPAPTDDIARLQSENKRLRDALAFYGKYENYERYNPEPRSVIDDDSGERARKALEGGE